MKEHEPEFRPIEADAFDSSKTFSHQYGCDNECPQRCVCRGQEYPCPCHSKHLCHCSPPAPPRSEQETANIEANRLYLSLGLPDCKCESRPCDHAREKIKRFARDAAKKERERCAKVASAHTDEHIHEERYLNCGLRIAAKIRVLPPEEKL